jgi:23S rRNA maturation mini-RNase III
MEELLRAMSAEEAVVAARDVSAAIAAGCDIDAEKQSTAVEDVMSLLHLLEDFAA